MNEKHHCRHSEVGVECDSSNNYCGHFYRSTTFDGLQEVAIVLLLLLLLFVLLLFCIIIKTASIMVMTVETHSLCIVSAQYDEIVQF